MNEPGLRWALLVGAEALLIVLLLPFGFVFTGTLGLHQFQLVVLGVVGLVGWIAVLARPTAISRWLVLAPLPLLAALVVTALVSTHPSVSWPATWVTFAYAGVFLLFALQASHPIGRRNLIAVIGIVVTLALVSFLVAVLLEWRDWLGLGFSITTLPLRPSNTGGLALIPTWLADLVALGVPVLVATAWSRGRRPLAVALALVALVAIVLTGTRSVLLIVAAVSVVAVLLAIRGRAGRQLVSATITVVILIGVVGAVVVLGSSRSLDEGRLTAYASAITRFTESPLIGSGPGTYGVERMHDPADVIGHLAFPDAHNIILNTASESGLIGLLGLVGTVALLVLAIRAAWLGTAHDGRLVIAGALFGVATFAAHGMVDVIFGLVGIVTVALAVAALASTTTQPVPEITPAGRRTLLRAATGAGLLVLVVVTLPVLRHEANFVTLADADAALSKDPAAALAAATRATATEPDLAPAWSLRMVAADATRDPIGADEAVRKAIGLEGYGQQWIALAVLASHGNDRATELDAIAHATDGPPVDPLVELNAAALLEAAGEHDGAVAAARRLLSVQPDIERIIRTDATPIAAVVASARADAAMDRLGAGDENSALVIALSGEDRALADALLTKMSATDPAGATDRQAIVDAWFGDQASRASVDDAARARGTGDAPMWAWRLAGRACDDAAMGYWERVLEIGSSFHPSTPRELVMAPSDDAGPLPLLYPTFVWKSSHPERPYVEGTLGFASGRPDCETAS